MPYTVPPPGYVVTDDRMTILGSVVWTATGAPCETFTREECEARAARWAGECSGLFFDEQGSHPMPFAFLVVEWTPDGMREVSRHTPRDRLL